MVWEPTPLRTLRTCRTLRTPSALPAHPVDRRPPHRLAPVDDGREVTGQRTPKELRRSVSFFDSIPCTLEMGWLPSNGGLPNSDSGILCSLFRDVAPEGKEPFVTRPRAFQHAKS